VGRLHLEGLDRLAVFAALVVALLAGVIVLVATGKVTLLLIALAALAVLFVVFAAKTGNVRKPAYYFLEWAIHVPMFIRGFSMRPRTPAEYPLSTTRRPDPQRRKTR